MIDADYWARYYEVTVDRPAWETIRMAIGSFAAEAAPVRGRFAVDPGCGAGRDARELLRAGWSDLAVAREPGAIRALEGATPLTFGPPCGPGWPISPRWMSRRATSSLRA